jgi:stage II sporulation protein P
MTVIVIYHRQAPQTVGGIEMAALIQRQFVLLSFMTAFLFVVTGWMALSGNRIMLASSAIQQAASHMPSLTLIRLMGQEIPALTETVQASGERDTESVTGFLFELATSIHPGDLRSLLGRELPGLLTLDDARVVVPGQGFTLDQLYVEYPAVPRQEFEAPQTTDSDQKQEDAAAEKPMDSKQAPAARPVSSGKPAVFVYHTHNRESWVSEAKSKGDQLDHPERNITLVGKRLAQELNDRGVGTEVSTADIYQRLLDQGLKYPLSYAESLKVLKTAQERNRELHYFFDLHRDTAEREKTTASIKGKTYARVLFVIGKRNKNHVRNEEFAKELHELMEKMYPGLSRGVIEKGAKTDHGEYNQSISPGSLLLEIGGTENTLQESYNTAGALADVFAEYYWQAEKVDKPQSVQPAKR